MTVSKITNYYLGMEFVNSCINGYEKIFDLSKLPQSTRDCINPDKTYSVLESIYYWDHSGGLCGDSEGEEHTIYYIEETPKEVLDIFDKMGQLKFELSKYENNVKAKNENL